MVRSRVLLMFACAGCWQATIRHADHETASVAPTAVPRASFEVIPADLAIAGATGRIKHRARIWRHGTYWASLGRPSDYLKRYVTEIEVLPVIATTRDKLRVVLANDQARIALWIDRGDAEPTIRAPIQVDAGRRIATTAGAWLEPGARITLGKQAASRVHVDAIDDQLAVAGWVPARALGTVWIDPGAPRRHRRVDPGAPRLRSEPRPAELGRAVLPASVAIVDRPERGAAELARSRRDVAVDVIARHGAWLEIEAVDQRVRVRGFVAAGAVRAAVADPPQAPSPGVALAAVRLPYGTCIYSAPTGDPAEGYTGEVIGVTVTGGQALRRSLAGWWRLEIATTWGPIEVFVHDEATASDAATARWESCAPEPEPSRSERSSLQAALTGEPR